MGRKLYFPVTGVPTGVRFRIDQGGTNADNVPEALTNLDGVSADKLNIANGLLKLNSNSKIDNARIPPGYIGSYIGPMVEGLTSLTVNQQATYLITDYDEFSTYVLSAISGIVSRNNNIINYKAPSSVMAAGFILNGKTYNITVSNANYVVKPTITSPVNNSVGNPNNLTITSSAFTVNSGSDTHLSSSWQLATDIGFTNIVQQVTDSTSNKTSWPVTFLSNNTTYYVRVRHKGTSFGYSAWSDVVTMTTATVPTYDVTVAGGTVSEGQAVTFNITTANVVNNTVLYWSIDVGSGNSVSNEDFISAINGSVTIVNNTASVTVQTLSDLLLEGTENFVFSLRSTSTSGPILATFNNSLLDTSYTIAGTKSLVIFNKYDSISKVITTSDNGILMAGLCYRTGLFTNQYSESGYTIALLKLGSNKQRSASFGTVGDGTVFIPEIRKFNNNINIAGLHEGSDGKIYITGSLYPSSFVIKLNNDGTRDNTFGNNGYLEFEFSDLYPSYSGNTDIIDSVLHTDGEIYLGTYVNTNVNTGRGIFAKINTTTGVRTILSNQYASYGQSLTELVCKTADNKLISISTGQFNISGSFYHMLKNHTDNLTIGSSELDQLAPSNLYADLAIAAFPTVGGFVIMNRVESESFSETSNVSLIAFNSNLTIKTNFGVNGIYTFSATTIAAGSNIVVRDLIASANHFYIIGSHKQQSNSDQTFLVIRVNLNGTLDTTFGDNGYKVVSINSKSDYGRSGVYSAYLQSFIAVGDTDILLTGASYNNPHNKSGTVGTLQTEVGMLFLNNTGNLV